MKTTCYSKKSTDIVVPELDDIIIKRVRKNNVSSFTNYTWNERAVKILARDYPKVKRREITLTELSRKAGKSYYAVRNKVRRMGLT